MSVTAFLKKSSPGGPRRSIRPWILSRQNSGKRAFFADKVFEKTRWSKAGPGDRIKQSFFGKGIRERKTPWRQRSFWSLTMRRKFWLGWRENYPAKLTSS